MITVLVLASSPIDQGQLHLGKELKLIKHSLDSATNREQFRIVSCTATTADDLRRYLLEHSPTIVHFCGHGAGDRGLCLESDDGTTHIVDGERLAKLFHLVNEDVKCVVLNACLSEIQAKAISEHIDFVVGMEEEIGDPAAMKFAQGFYEAIWAGRAYEKAFKFGCSAIDTANIPQDHVPIILKSPRLGGMQLEYDENTQEIENFILRFINSNPPERARLTVEGDAALDKIAQLRREGPSRVWSSVSVLAVQTLYEVYKEVQTIVRSGLDATNHTFYLKTDGVSFLVDWDATMGWWPIPIKTFKALGSSGHITVRVEASLSDYFNYGYDRDRYISIRLRHISGEDIHGYISRAQIDQKKLIDLLYDGRSHRVTLDIFPKGGEPSCVQIIRSVSDSWIIPSSATASS